jgi:hypothetical protein
MTVYRGSLDSMSGGDYAVRMAPGGDIVQDTRVVKREFITVGGRLIRSVWMGRYYDELLKSSIGQHVSVGIGRHGSLFGRSSQLFALKLPNGSVERLSPFMVIGGFMIVIIKVLVLAMVSAVVGTLMDNTYGDVLIVVGPLSLLVWASKIIVSQLRAWTSLA